MKSGKTLNYCCVSAILLCWEGEPSHLCSHFDCFCYTQWPQQLFSFLSTGQADPVQCYRTSQLAPFSVHFRLYTLANLVAHPALRLLCPACALSGFLFSFLLFGLISVPRCFIPPERGFFFVTCICGRRFCVPVDHKLRSFLCDTNNSSYPRLFKCRIYAIRLELDGAVALPRLRLLFFKSTPSACYSRLLYG